MKTKHNRETKALLFSSGESQLSDTERQEATAWLQDLESLTAASQAACSEGLPSKLSVHDLTPQTQLAIKAQHSRFQRFRIIKHLATAASLILVASGTLLHYTNLREQDRLERLETVLFLLEDADAAEANGWDTSDTVTIEALAKQLSEMQFADN